MKSRLIINRNRLLEVLDHKTKLIRSIVDHLDHIESNSVFIEEIEDAYVALDDIEAQLIQEKEITVKCPGCGFECAQIHSFCMVCGTKLADPYRS